MDRIDGSQLVSDLSDQRMLETEIKSLPRCQFQYFPVKLDTYKHRYKSGASGAIHNIVNAASSKGR
jgi:hypothetical protein